MRCQCCQRLCGRAARLSKRSADACRPADKGGRNRQNRGRSTNLFGMIGVGIAWIGFGKVGVSSFSLVRESCFRGRAWFSFLHLDLIFHRLAAENFVTSSQAEIENL